MDIIYEPEITYRRALQIDKMWAESDVTSKLYTEILSLASPKGDERALDVAVATGCLLQLLSENLPKGYVIGLDASPAMIRLSQNKLVKSRISNAAILRSLGDDLIFRDGMFNLVFCVNGLYHFSDPMAALKEMKRVLEGEGRLILCELEAPQDTELKEALTESFQLAHPDYRLFTVNEIFSLLKDAGFTVIQSATEKFTFDQHGIGGMPMGVHFLETRDMIVRRQQVALLEKFDHHIFLPAGEMMHLKGAVNFTLVSAAW
jgi:SAM-dependent methyltransferase